MSGIVLLIDCARVTPVAGIFENGMGDLIEIPRSPEDRRGIQLHTTLDNLLQERQLAWSDLAAIAVGAGPGPMTGTRVGLAAALGYATALDIPVYPLSFSDEVLDPKVVLQLLENETPVAPENVQPIYGREADAEPQFDVFGRPLAPSA